MITKIAIENFKGIKDRVEIDLKPITLLFGPNSAGKSTVVQAIHYAREVLSRKNYDPDMTEIGGDSIDLGGFRNFVYNHNENLPITIKIEAKFNGDLPPQTYFEMADAQSTLEEYTIEQLDNSTAGAQTCWVEFSIIWHYELQAPIVDRYSTGLDDEKLLDVKFQSIINKKPVYMLQNLNFEHELFEDSSLLEDFNALDFPDNGVELKTGIPHWGWDENQFSFDQYIDGFRYHELEVIINKLYVGPGQIISEELDKMTYIGPIRKLPSRDFLPEKYIRKERWASGLAAWDMLFKESPEYLKELNHWLEAMKTGYSIEIKDYFMLENDSPIVLGVDPITGKRLEDSEDYRKAFEKLPHKKKLSILDISNNIEVSPSDIGIGISQFFPIVVAALDNESSIVAVEQPELHIHPGLQQKLTELFIKQINGENFSGQFIIETHSEHMMLRILKRIEDTHQELALSDNESNDNNDYLSIDKTLGPDKYYLWNTQVSVVWVEPNSEGTKLTQLPIDETGEFREKWPRGFFEEREEDLF